MPLNVTPMLQVNPPSIPAGGGNVRVTFAANTDEGQSRLRADYSLGAGVPYQLTGATQLPATPVFPDPRDYRMDLNLQLTGNPGGTASVRIIAVVHEVNAGGQDGERFESVGRVAIQMAPAVAAAAAPVPSAGAGGSLGARLKSFREAREMTQKEAAEQAGVGRSTISRIENGTEPSDATRERLEAILRS